MPLPRSSGPSGCAGVKLQRILPIVERGPFAESADRQAVEGQLQIAVGAIRWPPDAENFTIYPESGKKTGEGNGVRPIRDAFVSKLVGIGWQPERRYPRTGEAALVPGAFDAWKVFGSNQAVVVEWETGNISSSHRAMNKIAMALLHGRIAAGYLVLPSRRLYMFLTDRVGNFPELEPYFPLWASVPITSGVLSVVEVEYDATSFDVPRIAKGTDGRALI